MCVHAQLSFGSPLQLIGLCHVLRSNHHTHPAASVTAPVWCRGSTLAPPAAVFLAVGTRAGLPPVGIGPRAWAAIAAVWVPPWTRPKKDAVEEFNLLVRERENNRRHKRRKGRHPVTYDISVPSEHLFIQWCDHIMKNTFIKCQHT